MKMSNYVYLRSYTLSQLVEVVHYHFHTNLLFFFFTSYSQPNQNYGTKIMFLNVLFSFSTRH